MEDFKIVMIGVEKHKLSVLLTFLNSCGSAPGSAYFITIVPENLSPNNFGSLLEAVSSLNVVTVTQGIRVLQNTIYIAGPGMCLFAKGRSICAVKRAKGIVADSIDILFETTVAHYRARVTALLFMEQHMVRIPALIHVRTGGGKIVLCNTNQGARERYTALEWLIDKRGNVEEIGDILAQI